MSMSASVPRAQNQVPIITELYEELGVESMTEKNALQTTAHSWRRAYNCSDGTPGKDLTDWKSAGVQVKLKLMTEKFLDQEGNGKRFWPQRPYPRRNTALEWPTDARKITVLVQQLFWRQNVNELRNSRNPARQHSVDNRSISSAESTPLFIRAPWSVKTSGEKAPHTNQRQRDRVLYSPESSSGTPNPTSEPASRLATSTEKSQNGPNTPGRSIADVMRGSVRPELARGLKAAQETSKQASNDVYEIRENEGEGGEVVERHSPTPPAPVAKMVSETNTSRDQNLAFDAEPLVEPKRTEKGQNHPKTPKKRKRIGRIGSRVGSEDDDETYTPSKSKRKQTASPKSATSALDSGSSKTQEKGKTAHPSRDGVLPRERKSGLRRNSEVRRSIAHYDSTNLLDRYQASRPSLESPSLAKSSQDSVASASQSQMTVDVVQQYPAMGENMHTFPAERQVAFMSPTKAQRTEPSPNDIATGERDTHATGVQSFRVGTNVGNLSAELSRPSTSPKTLPHPTTDAAPSAPPRISSSERTSTEQALGGARIAEIPVPQKENAKPSQSEHPDPRHSTVQTVEEIRPAPPALNSHSGAPQPFHSPLTPRTPPVITNQQPPASKTSLQVRYWIIESRAPQLNRVKWRSSGLSGKSMESLCSEIAALIHRPVRHSITVNLKAASENVCSDILCDKPETLQELQEDFAEVIKSHKKRGNTVFEITLEPDPSEGGVMSTVGVVDDGADDSDVAF